MIVGDPGQRRELTDEEKEQVASGRKFYHARLDALRKGEHLWIVDCIDYLFPNNEVPEGMAEDERIEDALPTDLLRMVFMCTNCITRFERSIMHTPCDGSAPDLPMMRARLMLEQAGMEVVEKVEHSEGCGCETEEDQKSEDLPELRTGQYL